MQDVNREFLEELRKLNQERAELHRRIEEALGENLERHEGARKGPGDHVGLRQIGADIEKAAELDKEANEIIKVLYGNLR